MQNQPIQSQTVISLTNLQIDPKFFKFGVCNFESDKFVCIKHENQDQQGQLTIIDVATSGVTTKPNKSEGALMHPKDNIIALKAKVTTGTGHILQIFNMGLKQKLKDLVFSENIIFWKWISLTKLACVTATTVYHVDISKENEAQVKILDRSGSLANDSVQIIGYCIETNEKWCALYGISTPDGGKTINGHIQLYLIENQKQQLLDGHCCTFGEALIHNDTYKSSVFCFFEKKTDQTPKIQINEIGTPLQGSVKHKKFADFPTDPQYPNDFPVIMHVCTKYGLLFLATKFGFLYAYEITSTQLVYKIRISESPIFVGTRDQDQDGLYVIAKNGNVILIRVNPESLVPYILNNCKYIPDVVQLGFKLAARFQLPGVDNMFIEQFNGFLIQNDIKSASQIAAQAPGTLLRNPQTIVKFKNLQQQPGQPQPLLIYFQTLLETTSLNKFEALELCGPVLQSGRKQFVENWLKDNKLECSEELGDMIKPHDAAMSVQVYRKANVHAKVIQSMMESNQMNEAVQYSQQTGATMDYIQLIKNSLMSNPEGALNIAKNLCKQNPSINVHTVAELFMQNNRPQEMTAFLVECMKGNKPEDGPWQTKVLEFNLMAAPQVAETILSMELWNQFNRQKIANLCEQKGLFQRALANYHEFKDIRRCILNTHGIQVEWLVNFIGSQQHENILIACQDLIKHNRNNFQIVVNVLQANYLKLDLPSCVQVFENVSSYDGIYLFLGAIIAQIDDKDIIFKYIEACTKCNQLRIVEQIIMERVDNYDPVRVKDFLKDMKLSDPKPLIRLCDIHGYIDELTAYLYRNNLIKYIEIFLFKVNPQATPIVLAALIDLECDENYIKQILYNIRGNCPLEPLIDEFEQRNKLRVLETWLDSRVSEGNQLAPVHNALAKIKIDTNQDIDNFLINNQFYDPKVIGKFCEERDPHLAVLAYKRSWGTCDQELIMITNKNALFQLQARYLVERQSKELWQSVLSEDNPYRKQIVDQVVQQALPDSKNVDEVSSTVQAFMEANLPNELLAMLEKIVLHNQEFGQFKKLQNLLIITAIKSDKSRVLDYINKLNNYDGLQIAKIALGEQYQLYEEAFVIYKKNNYPVEAIEVLINNIENFSRAAEFAEKTNLPDVWTKLANAYLSQFQVSDAISAFLKAKDASQYNTVIGIAENEDKFEILVEFLLMCREKIKDVNIDNSMAYCYAKLERLPDLELFINGANSTDAQKVGDKCYDAKLYEAAKILFVSIKNNSKIASCLVRLKQFQQAIDAAKKANTPKTWKELCKACVEAQEFRLAATAGMNIIIHPDHLEELINHYEEYGHQEEMISLLETGMGLERAHIGIYTELGILQAKYQPTKLYEHIKQYFSKINVSKVLRACERYFLWQEAVYLHSNYHEYDNALNIMMHHSPIAFNHDQFVNLILKCSNQDLYYRAMMFYFEEQPEKLNDLLKCLTTKIDVSRCVTSMRKTGYLPLITPFLRSVQNVNNKELNEALNEIHLESEDYESLKQSISTYEAFDQAALAKLCERHELTQFRRIASYLYRKAKLYEVSINLSKADQEYRDCIETAQESGKTELIEELLKFFVAQQEKEFFGVCLFTCYDQIKPDVVLELAWRSNMMDFAFPFFIQITRDLTHRVENVQKTQDQKGKEDAKKANDMQNKTLDFASDLMPPGFGTNMIMPAPEMMNMNPNSYQTQQQNPQFQTQSTMQPGNNFGQFQSSSQYF